jgi:hypothetical protein
MNLWKPFFIVALLFVFFNSKSVPEPPDEMLPAISVAAHNDLITKTGGYTYTAQQECGAFNLVISVHNSYDFSVEFEEVICTYAIQCPGAAASWQEKNWGEVCIPPGGIYSNSLLIQESSLGTGTNEIMVGIESGQYERGSKTILIEPDISTVTVVYGLSAVRTDEPFLDDLDIGWHNFTEIIFLFAAIATIIGVLSTRKKKKRR